MYKGTDRVLRVIGAKGSSPMNLESISNGAGLSLDATRKIVEWLKVNGYVTLNEKVAKEKLKETKEYGEYGLRGKMPEYLVFIKALKNEPIANLEKEEKQFGLMWAKKKGYIDIKDGRLVPLKEEKQV